MMILFNHLPTISIILIISSSLITISQSSGSDNWLTKSLDYFSLEKCSPLDKSTVTGNFFTCLNSPSDSSSSSTEPSSTSTNSAPMGQSKSGFGDWSQFTSSGGGSMGGFGSSGDFSGKSGSFNSFSSGQSSSSSDDSWPLSMINDLRQMINCFPKLIIPCMTESEVSFFDTIQSLFQAQVDYASPNASLIASEVSSSGCSNSISNTICYSTNVNNQNWSEWQVNWSDGQMCRFFDDISKCEISSFDKCSPQVRQFAVGVWESGLKVTPCLNGTNETTTTSSPSPSPTPAPANPVDQTKSLAPGLSLNPNQSPSSLTNVTNINSNDSQSLEPTVNTLTVNNMEPSATDQKDSVPSVPPTPIVPERPHPRFFGSMNGNDVNNKNEDDHDVNEFEVDEQTRDFKGNMKHSKLVRLHEVDGEGESRHDQDKKRLNVEEEQWSRIKEEFKRRMRESVESRESDESEYEEESEESDEDRNFDIYEDQKNHFGLGQRNQEDEHRDTRNDRANPRDFFGHKNEEKRQRAAQKLEREQKRNEDEARRRRKEDEERRREVEEEASRKFREEEREREERMREEDGERRREVEDRKREEEQRREEENEMRMERERENARRGWKDERTVKPERFLAQANPVGRWDNLNGQKMKKGMNVDESQSNVRDCIGSTINSWSSLAENHNSNNLMDLMCRNMDSIHSCLNKHPETKSNGQANRLGQLKFLYSALCDSQNGLKDNETIDRVKQCLADQSSSSSGSILSTKYPNGASSRFWH